MPFTSPRGGANWLRRAPLRCGTTRRSTSCACRPCPAPSAPPVRVRVRERLGGDLEACSFDPVTGFYRDGYCPASVAPPVVLEATHPSALEFVSRDDLEAYALRE